jgi:predicted transcriptional regulator
MDEVGATVLVVLDGNDPVGIITRSDLEGTPGRRPRQVARIDDVMTKELVVIDPNDGVLETLNKYTAQAWNSLRRRRPRGEEEMGRRTAAFTADE